MKLNWRAKYVISRAYYNYLYILVWTMDNGEWAFDTVIYIANLLK